jgi:hypothetical protein
MALIHPLYRGQDGMRRLDPWIAAGPHPSIDLTALAISLSWPALIGEWQPLAVWKDVEAIWEIPEANGDGVLAGAFDAAILELCDDADSLAVLFSGGLDSLAVLLRTAKLYPNRRLIAVTADMVDDQGLAALPIAARLIHDLGIACELIAVDMDGNEVPAWSAHGPHNAALPYVHAAAARAAEKGGAQVLLSGDGADGLWSAQRFLLAGMVRHRGLSAGWRYLMDSAVLDEAFGFFLRGLPPRWRTLCYWATAWPEMFAPPPLHILREPYRTAALDWADGYLRHLLHGQSCDDLSWASLDAHHAWWPTPFMAPASGLIEGSPFLDHAVAARVLSIPPWQRYDPGYPLSYWRKKGLVVGLFPAAVRTKLPRRKQYYRGALPRVMRRFKAAPIAVEARLFDARAIERETNRLILSRAAAIEAWLEGALAAGARIG